MQLIFSKIRKSRLCSTFASTSKAASTQSVVFLVMNQLLNRLRRFLGISETFWAIWRARESSISKSYKIKRKWSTYSKISWSLTYQSSLSRDSKKRRNVKCMRPLSLSQTFEIQVELVKRTLRHRTTEDLLVDHRISPDKLIQVQAHLIHTNLSKKVECNSECKLLLVLLWLI